MAIYHNPEHQISSVVSDILSNVLKDASLDAAYKNTLVLLPDFAELSAQYQPVNVHDLALAIAKVKAFIANKLVDLWLEVYAENQSGSYNFNDSGQRALKNTALAYLIASSNCEQYLDIVYHRFKLG